MNLMQELILFDPCFPKAAPQGSSTAIAAAKTPRWWGSSVRQLVMDTLGLLMPCCSSRNYGQDLEDGLTVAGQYQIETRTLDLAPLKNVAVQQLAAVTELAPPALTNLAPRLRMTALYAVAASENRLVAGTGNRSEAYVGYFTKWGDGAHDFNPISDLTVTEIYEFLRWLNAPACVIEKKPSAGLFDGQTDEQELGITYCDLDAYLSGEAVSSSAKQKIRQMHEKSEHKRKGIILYPVETLIL